jgi:hypothetical protein
MNRFVTDILPKALVDAQEKRKTLEYDKWEIARKLDYDEQWSDHDCDCEYCESNDYDSKQALGWKEREELEAQLEKLVEEIDELNLGIKRMTNYKEFMERQKI